MKLPPEIERKLAISAAKAAAEKSSAPEPDESEDMAEECRCLKCGYTGPGALFEASPTEGEPISEEDE